jgi:hypothetical protein
MTLQMSPTYLLLALPLLVSFSFVYAATRHERQDLILQQGWRTAIWITVFLGSIFLVLWLISLTL